MSSEQGVKCPRCGSYSPFRGLVGELGSGKKEYECPKHGMFVVRSK